MRECGVRIILPFSLFLLLSVFLAKATRLILRMAHLERASALKFKFSVASFFGHVGTGGSGA